MTWKNFFAACLISFGVQFEIAWAKFRGDAPFLTLQLINLCALACFMGAIVLIRRKDKA